MVERTYTSFDSGLYHPLSWVFFLFTFGCLASQLFVLNHAMMEVIGLLAQGDEPEHVNAIVLNLARLDTTDPI